MGSQDKYVGKLKSIDVGVAKASFHRALVKYNPKPSDLAMGSLKYTEEVDGGANR